MANRLQCTPKSVEECGKVLGDQQNVYETAMANGFYREGRVRGRYQKLLSRGGRLTKVIAGGSRWSKQRVRNAAGVWGHSLRRVAIIPLEGMRIICYITLVPTIFPLSGGISTTTYFVPCTIIKYVQ